MTPTPKEAILAACEEGERLRLARVGLGHEFENKGPALPGCKFYTGGDPADFSSYCGEPEYAHRPLSPNPWGALRVLTKALDETPCSCLKPGTYVPANMTHETWCAFPRAQAALSEAARVLRCE